MQRFHGRHFFSWGPIICLENTRESTFCTSSVTYHPQIQTDLNHPTIPMEIEEVSHVTFRVPRPWLAPGRCTSKTRPTARGDKTLSLYLAFVNPFTVKCNLIKLGLQILTFQTKSRVCDHWNDNSPWYVVQVNGQETLRVWPLKEEVLV